MPPLPAFPTLDPALTAPLHAAVVFLATLGALLGARWLALRRLRDWTAGTTSRVDDIVLAAIHTPSLFWCVAIALKVAIAASPVDVALLDVLGRAITVLVVISMTLVLAHVAGGVATVHLRRDGVEGHVPGLGQAVMKGVVVLLGGMIVLNVLGVEIAPLLTALGVGGLAVALALQDTLTNLFAGLHILLERPYTIGHFIRLDDGKEGHVLDIGWRTTRIRTRQDDVIVVPNSKMAGSTIVNFHMPIRRSRVALKVGVDYASDLEHVREVLVDVARAACTDLDYLLAEPPPEAVVLRFGDFSVDFELRFFVADIAREAQALDELHRRVFRRFRDERIDIPFPVRRIVHDGERGAAG